MRTLLVDDDPNIRGIVRRVLTRQFESLDIVECEDGLAALELLSKGEYDFVLRDVSMPLMDGLDVLQSVRRAPVIAKIPVIMMTGNNETHPEIKILLMSGSPEEVLHQYEPELEEVLSKPFTPTSLANRVWSTLHDSSPVVPGHRGPVAA